MLERFAMIKITAKKKDLFQSVMFTALHQAVGWTNYTNQPQMLEQALSHSLATYLARDEENRWFSAFGWRRIFIRFVRI